MAKTYALCIDKVSFGGIIAVSENFNELAHQVLDYQFANEHQPFVAIIARSKDAGATTPWEKYWEFQHFDDDTWQYRFYK